MKRGVRILGVNDFGVLEAVIAFSTFSPPSPVEVGRSGTRVKDGEWYCTGGAAIGGTAALVTAGLGDVEMEISSTASPIFSVFSSSLPASSSIFLCMVIPQYPPTELKSLYIVLDH